jgi:GTPase SAR1 family protein
MIQFIPSGYQSTCPYCVRPFHPADALLRPFSGSGIPEALDTTIAEFFGGTTKAQPLPVPLKRSELAAWIVAHPRRASRTTAAAAAPPASSINPMAPPLAALGTPTRQPSFSWLRRMFVHTPKGALGRWICPHCHLPLPPAAARGEVSPRPLAIIGPAASGKSNWIAVLVRQLFDRYSSELKFSIVPLETWSYKGWVPISSAELYQERYGRFIYAARHVEKTVVPKTDNAPDVRVPLIYRLTFENGKVLDLSLFDAAGEITKSQESLHEFGYYIANSSGIIFVLDPYQLSGFRDQLSDESGSSPGHREDRGQERMIGSVTQYFETIASAAERATARRMPVALAISKADEFNGRVHPGSAVLADRGHREGFDEVDSLQVHAEVLSLVDTWGGRNDVAPLMNTFKRSRLFAFSALGKRPDSGGGVGEVNPRRAGDPLLWLLSELGYIRRRHG